MNIFIESLKNYTKLLEFNGRERRLVFALFVALQFVLLVLALIAFELLKDFIPGRLHDFSVSILFFAWSFCFLSAAVRRMHDIGFSGWWMLAVVLVAPLSGVLLVCGPIRENNLYGPDPRLGSPTPKGRPQAA